MSIEHYQIAAQAAASPTDPSLAKLVMEIPDRTLHQVFASLADCELLAILNNAKKNKAVERYLLRSPETLNLLQDKAVEINLDLPSDPRNLSGGDPGNYILEN